MGRPRIVTYGASNWSRGEILIGIVKRRVCPGRAALNTRDCPCYNCVSRAVRRSRLSASVSALCRRFHSRYLQRLAHARARARAATHTRGNSSRVTPDRCVISVTSPAPAVEKVQRTIRAHGLASHRHEAIRHSASHETRQTQASGLE